MKIEIKKIYLETDINNEPRLIMIDENDKEWAVSEATASAPSGAAFLTEIVAKEKCWYFNEQNRPKSPLPSPPSNT